MKYIINPVYYQDFILAGGKSHPMFLLINTKTQKQDVFRVRRSKLEDIWWVNNQTFELLGRIVQLGDDVFPFAKNGKLITRFHQEQADMFEAFWLWMMKGKHSRFLELRYGGRCAHCGRELTHSESIPMGIGPDCFKKLGLTHKPLVNVAG